MKSINRIILKKENILKIEKNPNKNRFILVKDMRKYNSLINRKLYEIESLLKSDMELNNEYKSKINELSTQINEYKEKEKNLQDKIEDKDKIIEEYKNQMQLKDIELQEQKTLNQNLIEEKEQLNKKIEDLIKECREMEDKIKNIKNNESKYKDKDFKNLEEISRGGYGTLYSAFSTKDKIDLCLKKIDINFMEHQYNSYGYPENNYLKDLNNEIEILKLLSPYENSVKYYGDYQIIKEKIIVMEKCDEDVESYLIKRNKSLNEEEIKKIFIELNKIFEVMNKNNIIHRDLKLKNFLIKYSNKEKTDFIAKLCDYGIGKFLNDKNYGFSGMKGTLETIAPEIYLSKTEEYKSSVDIFSLGVIFYQLSHNLKHPYKTNELENLILKYNEYYDKDNYEIIFDNSIKNENFKDLVKKMLKLNPKNRINWEEYFHHPFFNKDS